ncbi:MAG: sel1 repeat family protein, partial [Deltaproteobacteria bacterium]|nr:sel1 repeat family protein [Deltaproteobacteria bacterium]MBW2535701.1 sel1 repeat family protein [Deltaproteobacteria bacterium]
MDERAVFPWVFAAVALWGTASASGCGPGSAAGALRPDDPTYAGAVGAGKEQGSRPRLLIVDWEPETRGDLEVAMKQGVAVVSYRDDSVRLLDACSLEGEYGFIGISRKERIVRLVDADEVKANLPFGGAALAAELGGEMKRGATLEVGLVMVGKRMTTMQRAFDAQLQGECDGATHFVRGAMVGAFVMATGTEAKVRTTAELFGVGAAAGSESAKQVRTREGELAECKDADPDDSAPPKQCGAPLRIDLAPIVPGDADTSVDVPALWTADVIAAACPDGFVLEDEKCTKPEQGTGHQCQGIDPVECDAQCSLDHGGSCLNLGWAYERGIGVDKDLSRAFKLYAKSCKLGTTEGCRALAFMYLNGLGVDADPGKALGYYRDACQAGDALGCSNLGTIYAHGKGVAKDIDRAVKLYRRACNGGSPRGCINLGQ